MFAEIAFGDVVFGVFPKVGYSVRGAYGYWAENSVGDVLDMILQTLEVCSQQVPWSLPHFSVSRVLHSCTRTELRIG